MNWCTKHGVSYAPELGCTQCAGECSERIQAAVESVHAAYRGEVTRLKMQLVVYRQMLVDHGIQPPDMEGEDLLQMVRNCNAVISTASEFVHHLGSAKELLNG